MANHSGGYMLNGVLKTLETSGIFETLGRENAQRLVIDIVNISLDYDCREYDVLEDIGERLGLCNACLRAAEEFRDGICIACAEQLGM